MPRPPSRYRAFEIVLDGRDAHPLTVRRAPLFLRFVLKGDDWRTLDALDQFDDTPRAGERVVAAERVSETPVHFKFSGKDKHKSGWYLWVKYTTLPDQPPSDVSADTASWQQWCRQRATRTLSPKPSGKP